MTDERVPKEIEKHLERLNNHLAIKLQFGTAPHLCIPADDAAHPLNRKRIADMLHAMLPALRMVWLDVQGEPGGEVLLFNEQNHLLPHLEEFLKLEPRT